MTNSEVSNKSHATAQGYGYLKPSQKIMHQRSMVSGDFYLQQGNFLNIVVGQMGINGGLAGSMGGGGGTYVQDWSFNNLLLVAGGISSFVSSFFS